MTRRFALVLVLLVPFVGDGFPAQAIERSASLNTEVGVGKWKAVKLRNLPKGVKLSIEIITDGAITLLLLDQKTYDSFPDINRPLLRSTTSTKFSFEFLIPRTGNYFAVLDNRAGNAARKVSILVTASAKSP